MLQITDIENHELFIQISPEESATVSGGTNSEAASITSILPIILMLVMMNALSPVMSPTAT